MQQKSNCDDLLNKFQFSILNLKKYSALTSKKKIVRYLLIHENLYDVNLFTRDFLMRPDLSVFIL